MTPFNAETPKPAGYDAIIAVGSNIGEKVQHIETAIATVCASRDVDLVKASRVYKTPPWGITDQDWFANACFSVRTRLDPHALLDWCLEVERQMGRRRTVKWGPRIIDLDVLLYRDVSMSDERLTLPHPHMSERAFVLVPLQDVAPDLQLKGHSLGHWLAKTGRDGIAAVEPVV